MAKSIISNSINSLSGAVSDISGDPLTQFYMYNSKSEIKAWKEQYIKSTCPNFSRWSKTLNKISICNRKDFGELQLSPHFKVSDYCRGSGNTLLVCMETIQILETIWNYFGKPVTISSGYRDPSYNKRVGGATGSMHMWGLAVDMKVPGLTAQVVGEFIAHYFPGCEIGVYGHADMRNSSNWVHVAPRDGYSDYNHRIQGTEIFRQYKSPNSPDEPQIYSDNVFGPTSSITGTYGGGAITSDGVVGGGYSQVSIDYKKLNPYVITIDRNTDINKIDIDLLKENGVIGFLVEGGYLFSGNHIKMDYFRNPKIVEQMDFIEENKIPFGLYMNARARTLEDVDEEIYEFSFLIRKYPPMFGAWLILNLSGSKSTNGVLIKRYQKLLERLGLKGKIGFYVTEEQLNQIDWEEFQNDWYLWIVKPIDDVSEIDKLLEPEFFDMDGDNPPADWVSSGVLGYSQGAYSGSDAGGDGLEKFISVAKSHIGTGGHEWVIKTAGIPKNLGWCAATMFAVAKECGFDGKIFPSSTDGNRWRADPNNGFVPAIYKTYGGKRIDGTPQRGDLFQRIGNPHNHVGLVIEVNTQEGTMKTIEGNTGTRINGERQLKSNDKKISSVSYFARPDWSKVSTNKNSNSNDSSINSTVNGIISETMSNTVNKVR